MRSSFLNTDKWLSDDLILISLQNEGYTIGCLSYRVDFNLIFSMLRFLCLLFIIVTSVSLTHGATQVPYTMMARDLTSILETRASMDILSPTGKSYTLFTREYFRYLDDFVLRYSPAVRVFALRPALDLTLSYHLRIQEYRLSCEIAALRIILERLGIIVSEQDIFSDIPLSLGVYGSGGIW